jgi:hypothetical protein
MQPSCGSNNVPGFNFHTLHGLPQRYSIHVIAQIIDLIIEIGANAANGAGIGT